MKEKRISRRLYTSLFCALVALACMAGLSCTALFGMVLPAAAASEQKQGAILTAAASEKSVGKTSAASEQSTGEPLTVGVPANRCPIFYHDAETNEITGIGVDLMRYAAEKAGYNVTFRPIKEKSIKDALDNKEYDLVMPFGGVISGAWGHPAIVSESFMQTPFTLVTEGKRKTPPLDKLRVGMLRSLAGVAETVRQLYPGIRITFYETMEESVDALRKGQVDALLNNYYVWSYVLQKPSYSDLKIQYAAFFSMEFRVGTLDTPKGRAIIERLNPAIASLSSIQRRAIVLDHTTRKLYKYDLSDYLHRYGLVILLVALLFIALIAIAVLKQRSLRLEHEKKLRELVDYDQLTGALSMNGFRKRVEELLRTYPDTPYFLSYNNIRDFKFINDSYGREAGDAFLKFWVAKSMEFMTDEEAIGRVTSDRFAVLRRIENEEKIRADEKNVIEPVENYFINQGKETRVQMCSGIYILTPKDFRKIDVDRMLDYARVAEQRALKTRKESYAFYNPEQWELGKHIADVINYLPTAIRSGDIKVWYQPQVDYETGKIIGAEALCRWAHTKLGCLQPNDFISTLEESGLIYDLDRYVWETVCQDLQRWNGQGHRRSVSVNLSRNDFREDRDIPGFFQHLVKTYGLSRGQLRIEITETAYADTPELLISTTEKLRELGFQVEMDDFGSGYSSLHMLKEVPVDRIKLDLRFLSKEGDPEKGRIIISSIIKMVRSLGMKLIAEGVETKEQADFLQSQGSSEMQGYYFYKPMSVSEFEKIGVENEDSN